ncbi:hypothetical protein FRB91_012066 [Serendipita sp. 411]|nr:hypothetical protein FRB91_012066 [Serendipita sp. 411]
MASGNATAPPVPEFVPSTIILGTFAKGYVEGADVQIAPWIMGTFADFFLQGILAAQTTHYFTYRDAEGQTRRFAWLVIVLTIMCLVKSAQNVAIVWNTVITNFANPDVSLMLVATNWVHYTTSLSTGIIAIYVQSFFVYRYWMLTKRWYICLVMVLGMTVSFIGSVLVIVYIPKLLHQTVKMWSLVHFVAAIVVDGLITACTAWHLNKRKSNIQTTADMIDRLVRMTWQSALPPTICVLLNLVILESRPIELTHIAFNMVLPKLYAISLLYTLNVRNEIRNDRTTSQNPSSGTHPNLTHVGKRSFLPGDMNSRGGISAGGPGAVERGVSFVGRGRGFSGGTPGGYHQSRPSRKLDGIHVETHISTHGGSSGNGVELDTFDNKVSAGNSDFEQEVWEGDKKYLAQ